MTKEREEAIAFFKDMNECTYGNVEHIQMAIKALEQEPCEDAISRQAVLDGVDRYIYKSQSTGTQDDFYSFAELVVKQLPSVTPQPKTDILDKIRAEIKGWQVDIHDNEYDADKHDFVFERIFEIIDEYKAESEE